MRSAAAGSETNINYKSVAIPHLFNFFTLNGPYTPTGASSHVPIAEAQVEYVINCIRHIAAGRIAMAPRKDKTQALFETVRARARETVWGSGCKSWFLDKTGVPMINPQTLDEVREDLAALDLSDWEQVPLEQLRNGQSGASPSEACLVQS